MKPEAWPLISENPSWHESYVLSRLQHITPLLLSALYRMDAIKPAETPTADVSHVTLAAFLEAAAHGECSGIREVAGVYSRDC